MVDFFFLILGLSCSYLLGNNIRQQLPDEPSIQWSLEAQVADRDGKRLGGIRQKLHGERSISSWQCQSSDGVVQADDVVDRSNLQFISEETQKFFLCFI